MGDRRTCDREGSRLMIAASITLVFNNLPRASSAVRSGLEQAIGAAGVATEGFAKGYAAVDTGAMRGSIATQHSGLTATVSAGTEYANYVEYGTVRAGAQPFMRPGLEAARPGLEAAIRSLLGRLA